MISQANLRARAFAYALAVGLLLLLTACAAAPPPRLPPAAAGEVEVLVTSNGWHTGIAIRGDRLSARAVPEIGDFPEAAWYEFGWGDAEYYPAPDTSIGMALRAALQPTPAVMHLAGLPGHPEAVFQQDEIVRLNVSTETLRRLVAYIDASFERGGGGGSAAVAPGLYPFSRFYPATGHFHLFNNCNTWTARALQAAGLPVRPGAVVFASDVMSQLRPVAEALRRQLGGLGRHRR